MNSGQTAIIAVAFVCISAGFLILGLLIRRAKHGRAQEALRRSEQRYLLALEGSTDGLWDWDIASGNVHYSDPFPANTRVFT